MALALILRSTPKAKGGSFQHILKTTSVILNRECTPTLFQKPSNLLYSNLSKTNLLAPVIKRPMLNNVRLMSADHSKLWPLERALSVGLLVIVPAAIAAPNFIFDNLLAVAAVIHFHWGLEAVVVDYVRPIIVGNVLPKVALGLLYLISAATLGGLIYYNVHSIGIGKTVRKFWAVKSGGGGEECH